MSNDIEAAKKLIATYGLPGAPQEILECNAIPDKELKRMRIMMIMFAMWDQGITDILFNSDIQGRVCRFPGAKWTWNKDYDKLLNSSDGSLKKLVPYLTKKYGEARLPTLGLKDCDHIVNKLDDE